MSGIAATMEDMTDIADRFLALHTAPDPLLLPNPWDVGSARLLASLGFTALATTSSGAAAAHGLTDGALGVDAAIAHVAAIAGATALPVNADLENGFADDPGEVPATVHRCAAAGAAGASIEDWDPIGERIYDRAHATERIAAAVAAAHGGPARVVLTARAENHIRGHDELDDTVARLTAYAAAGADVVYAPGLTALDDIRRVVDAVDRPVNVLAWPGVPGVAELAAVGVRRISVGGAFAFTAYGALIDAARELRERGTYGYLDAAGRGAAAVRRVFGDAATRSATR